jgi:hypothetical protein
MPLAHLCACCAHSASSRRPRGPSALLRRSPAGCADPDSNPAPAASALSFLLEVGEVHAARSAPGQRTSSSNDRNFAHLSHACGRPRPLSRLIPFPAKPAESPLRCARAWRSRCSSPLQRTTSDRKRSTPKRLSFWGRDIRVENASTM